VGGNGVEGRYHWLGKLREPTWYPYTKARRGLIDRVAQAFNARDLKRRLGMRLRQTAVCMAAGNFGLPGSLS
jgi:hypothetical protein